LLLQHLPLVYLSGIATQQDDLVDDRATHIAVREQAIKDQIISETLDQEIIDKIESPPRPKPDLRDPTVFQPIFEERNKHLGLYYTPGIMTQTWELLEDIHKQTNYNDDYPSLWDGRIEYLLEILAQVRNPYSRASLKDRYVSLLS